MIGEPMSSGRSVRRIGRYEIEAAVGAGAFATVYRAFDQRLEATVAVKVLAENRSLDPELRERFLTEGRVLRRIDSPHVVTVHDLGETDDRQPFLVLEYADRGTLANRVARARDDGWQPDRDDVVSVAEPLARALEAVHGADVVHRDLNPGNVLLSGRGAAGTRRSQDADVGDPANMLVGGPGTAGRVSVSPLIAHDERLVLADLGLSKDLALNSGQTVAGGTDGFRPPEQRGAPAVVDGRADLWSLSALVVWLVTGSPPEGGSVRELIVQAGLPARLAEVLDTSLADDPSHRHADPVSWLDAVQDALASPRVGSAASLREPSGPASDASDGPGRRQTVPAARFLRTLGRVRLVGAVVGALLLAVGGFGLGRVWWDSGDSVTVSQLGDGAVRVALNSGDATLAIEGPEEVAAGEQAVFIAQVEDLDDWWWIGPDGQLHHADPQLEVQAVAAGTVTVALIGWTAGEALLVDHNLQVLGD